eukprot:TRINITY_DN403_c0_g1_i1.p1 TRINITY_DN403_c0_g1~~TRINITY_DN403_c0_g1_i1.p1  ORF type:complete len:575 (-),score=73.63 TRINITY_DN403_c0_g1_i1:90-1814(-)
MSFADSWITATLSQFCAQALSTVFIVLHYNDTLGPSELVTPLLNFNLGMLFVPLLYWVMERFDKNRIFLAWQIDEELRNWKTLFEILPIGILVVRDRDVTYSNKAIEELIGVQNSLNERLKDVVSQSEDTKSLYQVLLGENSGLNTSMLQEKYYYKQTAGNIKPLAVSITKLALGNKSSYVAIIQDLTIYEQLDEEKAYRQYQKAFFAMITHELRNPLQGMLGIFELLRLQQNLREQEKQCTMGLNTGKLMLCLIQDMLDLSQIEANKFSLNDEVFSPEVAVTECVEVMEFQYHKKGLELYKKSECDAELLVKTDKTRYKQVLFNLLGNALKFTPSGHVKIVLSYLKESNMLKTTVSDTGIGIKSEEQPRLFQMYGKMDSHRQSNPQGVGFGLHICKKLTQAMGGEISLRSEYGKGSEFTFTVLNKLHEPPKPEIIMTKVNSKANLKEKKVLVVDDENICGYVLQQLISSLGYMCELACSGEEAVKKIENEAKTSFGLIFLDINMPGMNGYETAILIREIFKRKDKPLPSIIGLTGESPEEIKQKAEECGMVHVLAKPLDKDKLSQCLVNSIGQ